MSKVHAAVKQAIADLKATGEPFTIESIADIAGYSYKTIHNHPLLMFACRKASIESIAAGRESIDLDHHNTEWIDPWEVRQWAIAQLKQRKPFVMEDFLEHFGVSSGWLHGRPDIYKTVMIAAAFSKVFPYRDDFSYLNGVKYPSEELWAELAASWAEWRSVFRGSNEGRKAQKRYAKAMRKAAKIFGLSTQEQWNELIDKLDEVRPDWRGYLVHEEDKAA